jgi:hypothetical protein
VYIVSADAVITGLLSPGISDRGSVVGASSVGAEADSKFCCATRRARVRVAMESDVRRLFVGRTCGLLLENV